MKVKMKGFTLIEIIVAIAVIGVLSAILVPSIIGHVGKSKLASANANAKLAYETAAAYCVDTRTAGYPAFDDVNCVSLKWDSDTRPTYLLNGEDMRNALKANMGENFASAGYVSLWNEKIFVTDGFLIEPKNNVNYDFVYYFLKSREAVLKLLQGGAAIPHVTPKLLNNLQLQLPPLPTQQKIAS
ncbi:MAG: restriction endonuclease subunit S, partial [Oscillospiraceae bacterium]|nr:restriction endonuclease subunit S [Oscillospiraceae bacterium]